MSENKGIFNFKKLNIKNKNELNKEDEINNDASSSKKTKSSKEYAKKVTDAEKNNSKNAMEKDASENSKADKKERIIKEGYNLFTNKGIVKTSIQDIVDRANVAKGTFYLYFKDKYELRDYLIIRESQKLFDEALSKLKKTELEVFTEQIIFIIDYVIDVLTKNQLLLKLIEKDLGWGVFNKAIMQVYTKPNEDGEKTQIYNMFMDGVKANNIKLKNPEATLYMIVELSSSTCFNSILYKKPLPIKEFKPILYDEIRKMIGEESW